MMDTRGQPSIKLLLSIVFLALGFLNSHPFFVGNANGMDSSRSLLEACLVSQRATDYISMKVRARHTISPLPNRPNLPLIRDITAQFRRQGPKYDLAYDSRNVDRGIDQSQRYRIIVTETQAASYMVPLSSSKPPRAGVAALNRVEVRKEAAQLVTIPASSLILDGYFPHTNGVRLAELALNSDPRSVGQETIGGQECTIIQAKTPYGVARMWLVAARGGLPVKIHFIKRLDDLYEENKIWAQVIADAKVDTDGFQGHSLVVEGVRLGQVEGRWIPLEGMYVARKEYANGREENQTFQYTRSDIHFNPDFAGTDAFRLDMQENAKLTNLDDPDSGIMYTLKNGKVIKEQPEVEGATQAFQSNRSWLRFIVAIVSIILLGIVTVVILLRQRREKQT